MGSALFAMELEALARAVGAGPTKQIAPVPDGAGWHTSPQLRVPEHVCRLYSPPHSPAAAAGHSIGQTPGR